MLMENRSTFVVTYPALGKYAIQYDVADKYGNTSQQRGIVDVSQPVPEGDALTVTLPGPAPTADGGLAVQVGKALDNNILFYVDYKGNGDCYVDKDIATDSNRD